jgi:hypothetical protein
MEKGMAPIEDALIALAASAVTRNLISPVMGEMVALKDWAATPLGTPAGWPLELRAMIDVVLASRFPMVFWWGPDLIQIYNDAYLPIIGDKHPAALGQTARECWAEIWDAIGPQIDSVQSGGLATWNEDVLLDINRHGSRLVDEADERKQHAFRIPCDGRRRHPAFFIRRLGLGAERGQIAQQQDAALVDDLLGRLLNRAEHAADAVRCRRKRQQRAVRPREIRFAHEFVAARSSARSITA